MLTKFRCRDLKTHEIVAYEVIQNNTWMVSHDDTFEKWSRGTWWVDCIREQCIGHTDIHGKEMFLGDICDFGGTIGVWRLDNYEYKVFNKEGKWMPLITMCSPAIIGNTLSNPDLISPEK